MPGDVALQEIPSRGTARGGVRGGVASCSGAASCGAVAGGCASSEPSKFGVASGKLPDADRAARARSSADAFDDAMGMGREGRRARSCSTDASGLRLVSPHTRFCIRSFSRACEMIVLVRELGAPAPAAAPARWVLLERAGEVVLPSQSVDSSRSARLARRARASLSFRCVLASPRASAAAGSAAPASAESMDR